MFKKEQSYRRLIAYGVGGVAIFTLVIGVLWILSTAHVFLETWSTVLGAIVSVITFVATVSTLFSLLVLWPDLEQEARQEARKEMMFLILEYKDIRGYFSSSDERTHDLLRVASDMREQAYLAGFLPAQVRAYLISDDEGKRIAGLAFLQSLKDVDHQLVNYFDQVLKLMNEPRSSFEQ